MEIRNCVKCGVELEVLEARDEDTGELVPVPEEVICGRCACKDAFEEADA